MKILDDAFFKCGDEDGSVSKLMGALQDSVTLLGKGNSSLPFDDDRALKEFSSREIEVVLQMRDFYKSMLSD